MKPALIDISVLLIFFNRPFTLKEVFAQVKKARPSRLFLYQDGPRNEKDLAGIEGCRKIVADIDWECEVHTLYQEKNFGCDPSGFIADTWAFTMTDKCIILEDDCVPALSFFPFCKEMLDKYENDWRVWMISGFNTEEITKNVDSDYFFSEAMTVGAWATWKRVIDTWDGKYTFIDDPLIEAKLADIVKEHNFRSDLVDFIKSHKATGKEFFETVMWSSMILNSGLVIFPKKNMIENIGTMADSSHFDVPVHLLPKGHRRIFTMGKYETEFPLKHPKYVIANTHHKRDMYKANAWDYPWIKVGRTFEELYLNLRYGNFRNIRKSAVRRLKKILRIR